MLLLKKLFTLMALLLLFNISSAQAAEQETGVVVNGKELKTDPKPFIYEGRLMIPVRFIAEEMGAQVYWDADRHIVAIEQGQGDRYLKGQLQDNDWPAGIMGNLVRAGELKDVLDDDKDDNLADYRGGHNGGDQISNDPLVLDIRKQSDYDATHIPGAVWLATAEKMAEAENLLKLSQLLDEHVASGGKKEMVLYCYTGNTSGLVAGVLGSMGFPVKNLMYGFDIGWRGTKYADRAIYGPMENNSGKKVECGG